MDYDPRSEPHGLAHDPVTSLVVPRPIGWISTLGADGVANLAPFSQFQNIGFDPPIVMFSANQNTRSDRKHSAVNAERSGEFVWNMATYDLREAVNITSREWPADVDEFEQAGLTKAKGRLVGAPLVAESPVQFECVWLQTTRLPGNGVMGTVDVVFGRVVAVHIDDAALTAEGRLDIPRLRPLARLGYHDYTFVDHAFTMSPPDGGARGAGLEGSPEKVNAILGTRP